jgi:predicted SAM-dependent methyltransferase
MSTFFYKAKRKLFELGIIKKKAVVPDTARINQLLATTDKLHIGCGDVKLPGFINMDFRATLATDIAADCTEINIFPPGSLSLVYSHAFFEHLYRLDRIKNLKTVFNSLKNDGRVVYMGFPDFKVIAKAYLDKEKGLIGDRFNLYHVYRFTHGDPEHVKGWWLEQLHKSLFDTETVSELLTQAGFSYYCIFNYCFKNEHLPVNMGFVAFKSHPANEVTKDWVINYLKTITDVINPDSLNITVSKT